MVLIGRLNPKNKVQGNFIYFSAAVQVSLAVYLLFDQIQRDISALQKLWYLKNMYFLFIDLFSLLISN